MALRDRLTRDIGRAFINTDHFGSEHRWNGRPIMCVSDGETAIKRKNQNSIDISWDNNISEELIYCAVEGFPGRPQPNDHVLLDSKPMRVLQVQSDSGLYAILLAAYDPKVVNQ